MKGEMIEGPEAFRRFDSLVGSLLAVPKDEIKRRVAADNKKTALTPRKRGRPTESLRVGPVPAVRTQG